MHRYSKPSFNFCFQKRNLRNNADISYAVVIQMECVQPWNGEIPSVCYMALSTTSMQTCSGDLKT